MGAEEQRFYANYRALQASELKMGDILVVKDFGGPIESGLDSFVVRSTQAVFSHVRGGSFYSEHCMLFARDSQYFGDPPVCERTVEANEKGVTVERGILPRQHLVYRFYYGSKQVRELMRFRAVEAGRTMAGENGGTKVPYAAYKIGGMPVPSPKAVGSFFRSKNRGNSANKHLTALYNAVFGSAAMPPVRVICSELVATCYELAALYNWHQNLFPFESCLNIDPRGMTAKALESVLNSRPHLFKIVGRYQGQNGLFVSGPVPQTA